VKSRAVGRAFCARLSGGRRRGRTRRAVDKAVQHRVCEEGVARYGVARYGPSENGLAAGSGTLSRVFFLSKQGKHLYSFIAVQDTFA